MFDLESAIRRWRETMKRNESLEEAFNVELESHLRDEVDRSCREGASIEEAFRKAAGEIGQAGDIGAEFYKAYTPRRGGRPPWKPGRSLPALLGNSLKIALRKSRQYKAYSLINIAGLAFGLACCILIVAYVLTELSYDGPLADGLRPHVAAFRLGTAHVEAGIALLAALLLMLWRVRGEPALPPRAFRTRNLDALVLLGGGFSMAAAIEASGLSSWLGAQLAALRELPAFARRSHSRASPRSRSRRSRRTSPPRP